MAFAAALGAVAGVVAHSAGATPAAAAVGGAAAAMGGTVARTAWRAADACEGTVQTPASETDDCLVRARKTLGRFKKLLERFRRKARIRDTVSFNLFAELMHTCVAFETGENMRNVHGNRNVDAWLFGKANKQSAAHAQVLKCLQENRNDFCVDDCGRIWFDTTLTGFDVFGNRKTKHTRVSLCIGEGARRSNHPRFIVIYNTPFESAW
jgi:hypothetical protein